MRDLYGRRVGSRGDLLRYVTFLSPSATQDSYADQLLGHMFCSECLHSSMNMDPTKKNCPVCRQKLEPRSQNGRPVTKSAKTFFHLELKVMPANRRGKRPAIR